MLVCWEPIAKQMWREYLNCWVTVLPVWAHKSRIGPTHKFVNQTNTILHKVQFKYRRVICWQGKEKMIYWRKNWIFCRTSKSLTKRRNIAQLRLQMLTHVLVLISHCVLSLIVVVMLYYCLVMTLSTCRANTEGKEPIQMMDQRIRRYPWPFWPFWPNNGHGILVCRRSENFEEYFGISRNNNITLCIHI